MRLILIATFCAVGVGLLAIWASDHDTAHACATKGRAQLLGGKVIECRVVIEGQAAFGGVDFSAAHPARQPASGGDQN